MKGKIVIFGTGNMARFLILSFQNSDYQVVQVFGRNHSHYTRLIGSMETQPPFTNQYSQLRTDADIYILAVSDDAIQEVSNALASLISPNSIVIHTSGAKSSQILQTTTPNHGVLWPVHSFNSTSQNQAHIPWVTTSSNRHVQQHLLSLSNLLGTHVLETTDDKRLKMHLVATMGNNFAYFLLHNLQEYCIRESISFSIFESILKQTISLSMQASDNQSGPAKRNDSTTIESHQELLSNENVLAELYSVFTKQIQSKYQNHEDRR